jgi:hypothetical protein
VFQTHSHAANHGRRTLSIIPQFIPADTSTGALRRRFHNEVSTLVAVWNSGSVAVAAGTWHAAIAANVRNLHLARAGLWGMAMDAEPWEPVRLIGPANALN